MPGRYRPLRCLLVAALGALLLGTGLLQLTTKSHYPAPSPGHVVVIDSGSSGTRIYVFRWTYNTTQASPEQDPAMQLPVVTMLPPSAASKHLPRKAIKSQYQRVETRPGLHQLLNNLPHLEKHALAPLLTWAKAVVPRREWSVVPIFMFATAGMRKLSPDQQLLLMDTAADVLERSGFRFSRGWVRIMTGADEGIFDWVAANYHAGRLGKPQASTMEVQHGSGQSLLPHRQHYPAHDELISPMQQLDSAASAAAHLKTAEQQQQQQQQEQQQSVQQLDGLAHLHQQREHALQSAHHQAAALEEEEQQQDSQQESTQQPIQQEQGELLNTVQVRFEQQEEDPQQQIQREQGELLNTVQVQFEQQDEPTTQPLHQLQVESLQRVQPLESSIAGLEQVDVQAAARALLPTAPARKLDVGRGSNEHAQSSSAAVSHGEAVSSSGDLQAGSGRLDAVDGRHTNSGLEGGLQSRGSAVQGGRWLDSGSDGDAGATHDDERGNGADGGHSTSVHAAQASLGGRWIQDPEPMSLASADQAASLAGADTAAAGSTGKHLEGRNLAQVSHVREEDDATADGIQSSAQRLVSDAPNQAVQSVNEGLVNAAADQEAGNVEVGDGGNGNGRSSSDSRDADIISSSSGSADGGSSEIDSVGTVSGSMQASSSTNSKLDDVTAADSAASGADIGIGMTDAEPVAQPAALPASDSVSSVLALAMLAQSTPHRAPLPSSSTAPQSPSPFSVHGAAPADTGAAAAEKKTAADSESDVETATAVPIQTLGTLDLGGSSLEVTYEVPERSSGSVEVQLAGRRYSLHTCIAQGLGLNDAWDAAIELLLQDYTAAEQAGLLEQDTISAPAPATKNARYIVSTPRPLQLPAAMAASLNLRLPPKQQSPQHRQHGQQKQAAHAAGATQNVPAKAKYATATSTPVHSPAHDTTTGKKRTAKAATSTKGRAIGTSKKTAANKYAAGLGSSTSSPVAAAASSVKRKTHSSSPLSFRQRWFGSEAASSARSPQHADASNSDGKQRLEHDMQHAQAAAFLEDIQAAAADAEAASALFSASAWTQTAGAARLLLTAADVLKTALLPTSRQSAGGISIAESSATRPADERNANAQTGQTAPALAAPAAADSDMPAFTKQQRTLTARWQRDNAHQQGFITGWQRLRDDPQAELKHKPGASAHADAVDDSHRHLPVTVTGHRPLPPDRQRAGQLQAQEVVPVVQHPCLAPGFSMLHKRPHTPPATARRQMLVAGSQAALHQFNGSKHAYVELQGTADWTACQQLAQRVVTATATAAVATVHDGNNFSADSHSGDGGQCLLGSAAGAPQIPFVALSGFYVVWSYLGRPLTDPPSALLAATAERCALDWQQDELTGSSSSSSGHLQHMDNTSSASSSSSRGGGWRGRSKSTDEAASAAVNAERFCLWGPYVVALLREGLKLHDSSVSIGSRDLGWPIGAALTEGLQLLELQAPAARRSLTNGLHGSQAMAHRHAKPGSWHVNIWVMRWRAATVVLLSLCVIVSLLIAVLQVVSRTQASGAAPLLPVRTRGLGAKSNSFSGPLVCFRGEAVRAPI